MQGAREYATMFSSGQHRRLYLVCGQHARGRTFHIWVMPSAEPVAGMPWYVKDAVEVYGVTGGQPGWTETYGWLHRGKWEQDFAALVEKRRVEIAAGVARREQEKADAEAAERQRKVDLLAAYEAEANTYLHQQVKLTEKELDELNAKFHPVPPPKIPRTGSWNSTIAGILLFGAAGTMIYLIIAVCQLLYKLFGG